MKKTVKENQFQRNRKYGSSKQAQTRWASRCPSRHGFYQKLNCFYTGYTRKETPNPVYWMVLETKKGV